MEKLKLGVGRPSANRHSAMRPAITGGGDIFYTSLKRAAHRGPTQHPTKQESLPGWHWLLASQLYTCIVVMWIFTFTRNVSVRGNMMPKYENNKFPSNSRASEFTSRKKKSQPQMNYFLFFPKCRLFWLVKFRWAWRRVYPPSPTILVLYDVDWPTKGGRLLAMLVQSLTNSWTNCKSSCSR